MLIVTKGTRCISGTKYNMILRVLMLHKSNNKIINFGFVLILYLYLN